LGFKGGREGDRVAGGDPPVYKDMSAYRRQVDDHHPLIPGYTGYIPLRYYRIGTSFGNDSIWCVNTFRDATQRKNDQVNTLRYAAATEPQLPPISSNEDVINVLDDYNYKHHPNVLGMNAILLHMFKNDVWLDLKEVLVTKPKESRPHQRFYRPEGMLPKYTGHIPHERSGIGKTFGNVCRSCSVCNHSDVSYGAYLAKKHKAENVQEPTKEDKKDVIA
ncbi:hypothetical protein JD844_006797, partial [Phrynosoma platyrhinos]